MRSSEHCIPFFKVVLCFLISYSAISFPLASCGCFLQCKQFSPCVVWLFSAVRTVFPLRRVAVSCSANGFPLASFGCSTDEHINPRHLLCCLNGHGCFRQQYCEGHHPCVHINKSSLVHVPKIVSIMINQFIAFNFVSIDTSNP